VIVDVKRLFGGDGVSGQLGLQGQQPVLGPVISAERDQDQHGSDHQAEGQDHQTQDMRVSRAARRRGSDAPFRPLRDCHALPPPLMPE